MWIDATSKWRTIVLGLQRVYSEHTSKNIRLVVLELLREYNISGDQIGYFMLDNALLNNTAVKFILKDLCL